MRHIPGQPIKAMRMVENSKSCVAGHPFSPKIMRAAPTVASPGLRIRELTILPVVESVASWTSKPTRNSIIFFLIFCLSNNLFYGKNSYERLGLEAVLFLRHYN